MRWSYKTIHYELKKEGLLGSAFLDAPEIELSLNEYGRAGWELVSILETMDGVIAVFKQSLSGDSLSAFHINTGESDHNKIVQEELTKPEGKEAGAVSPETPTHEKTNVESEVELSVLDEYEVVEMEFKEEEGDKADSLESGSDVGTIRIE